MASSTKWAVAAALLLVALGTWALVGDRDPPAAPPGMRETVGAVRSTRPRHPSVAPLDSVMTRPVYDDYFSVNLERLHVMSVVTRLKHATKLLGVYARQVEALDKHRGHGQQKITVEHVNVHAGGQAIVGNLDTGAAGVRPTPAPPLAIANNPDAVMPAMEMVATAKKTPAKR